MLTEAIKILEEETVKMKDFFAEMDAKIAAAQKVVADAKEFEPMSDEEFDRLSKEFGL